VINGDHTPLPPWNMAYCTTSIPILAAVSRITLLEEVWGYDYEGGEHVVDSIVRSLRRKLKSHASAITNLTVVGWRFDGFKI